jgi:hypothetical protein
MARPKWKQTLDYYAAENRGESLPEAHLEDADFTGENHANRRGRIQGFTTAQRAETMRAYRNKPSVQQEAIRQALARARQRRSLPAEGPPSHGQGVTILLNRKQNLVKAGYSATDADARIEDEDSREQRVREYRRKGYNQQYAETYADQPRAVRKQGNDMSVKREADGFVPVKEKGQRPDANANWFTDRLKKGRELAMRTR